MVIDALNCETRSSWVRSSNVLLYVRPLVHNVCVKIAISVGKSSFPIITATERITQYPVIPQCTSTDQQLSFSHVKMWQKKQSAIFVLNRIS